MPKKNSKNNYGNFELPYYSMVSSYTDGKPRGVHYLVYPNAVPNQKCKLNKVPVNYHLFGKYYKNKFGDNSAWYPQLNIDINYSDYSGGYSYPNSSMGIYLQSSLENSPAKIYTELNRVNNSKVNHKK